MAVWKIPLLIVMTVASLGVEGILASLAFRRKVTMAGVGFIFGILGILAMGGLASIDQSPTMQWVEESVNTIGQLGFMVGCILLYRNFTDTGCDTPA